MLMLGPDRLVVESGENGVVGEFDQLAIKDDVIGAMLAGEEWLSVMAAMKEAGVERVMPASENGVRANAVQQLAQVAGIDCITVPGSERELTWAAYLAGEPKPDPVHYPRLVAASKHLRVKRMPYSESERLGVVDATGIERRTVTIAFDTLILKWDGNKYDPREKPLNRGEARRTIAELVSGEPFLVSTVGVAHWLHDWRQMGEAVTLLPVRVETKNWRERARLSQRWLELYDQIVSGMGGPWKLTPAGGPSLMHPAIQPHIRVGLGGELEQNVLPADFMTLDWVPTGEPYCPMRLKDIGDEAYRSFAAKIVARGAWLPMQLLPSGTREEVGMIFAGFGNIGMREAIGRLLRKSRSNSNPATHLYMTHKLGTLL